MNTSDSIQKIYEALATAQAAFKDVGKSGENKFDNYKYANLENYVDVVRPVLGANGLSFICSLDEVVELKDRPTAGGKLEHAVRVKMAVRIVHTSGEWIETTCWGEGQDRADKAVYKAITGARKYALASAFNLATSDDPEADEDVGKDAGVGKGRQGNRADGGGATPAAAPPKTAKQKPQLTPEAKAFLDRYTAAMVKRGCIAEKAQSILRDALTKKKTMLNELSDEHLDAVMGLVEAGEWDKLFKNKAVGKAAA